jgi:hypothetical protein
MKEIERLIAEESPKVFRAAEKLRKQWADKEAKTTPEAKQKVKNAMNQWIAANAKHRVPVTGKKNIALFNQNADPAEPSNKIKRIASQLYGKNS